VAAGEARPRASLVIADAQQLLTCAGDTPYDLSLVEHGWVAIAGETIAAVGSRAEVEAAVDCRGAEVIDAAGCVVAPGFVDSHTHLVFAGSRVEEYAAGMTEGGLESLRRTGARTGVLATV
jgi:imidazolonepropionase